MVDLIISTAVDFFVLFYFFFIWSDFFQRVKCLLINNVSFDTVLVDVTIKLI